jgi:hypothetical protein
MQFTTFTFAAFAASGAFALPQGISERTTSDRSIKLLLEGKNVDSWLAVGFSDTGASGLESKNNGPFQTVKLTLGKDVKNRDLRCKIFDEAGNHIVVTRGENIDHTLGDGDKGAWTIKTSTKVFKAVCDPAFKKISPDAVNAVQVILSNDRGVVDKAVFSASEVTRNTDERLSNNNKSTSITVLVGPGVPNQALRCKAIDNRGNVIKAQRGANKDTTFADAGKGAWKFLDGAAEVDKIICDPSFKKASA